MTLRVGPHTARLGPEVALNGRRAGLPAPEGPGGRAVSIGDVVRGVALPTSYLEEDESKHLVEFGPRSLREPSPSLKELRHEESWRDFVLAAQRDTARTLWASATWTRGG